MTSLEFASLRKTFGGTTALSDVSFRCRPGEIAVLTGATGAGKTTALRIAAGLTHPTEGNVLYGGALLSDYSHPPQVAGFCIDPTATHPGRHVRATLTHAALLAGVSKRNVGPMADFVGLGAHLSHAAGKLSSPHQYRLALGVALMGDPDILVLDEPLTYLQEADVPWLVGVLRSLAAKGSTVLVSCGLDVDATHFADRIITMRLGRIVKDLSCDESAPPRPRPAAQPATTSATTTEPDTRSGRRPGRVPGGQLSAAATRAATRASTAPPAPPSSAPAPASSAPAPSAPPAPPIAQPNPTVDGAAATHQAAPSVEEDEPQTLDDVFKLYVDADTQARALEEAEEASRQASDAAALSAATVSSLAAGSAGQEDSADLGWGDSSHWGTEPAATAPSAPAASAYSDDAMPSTLWEPEVPLAAESTPSGPYDAPAADEPITNSWRTSVTIGTPNTDDMEELPLSRFASDLDGTAGTDHDTAMWAETPVASSSYRDLFHGFAASDDATGSEYTPQYDSTYENITNSYADTYTSSHGDPEATSYSAATDTPGYDSYRFSESYRSPAAPSYGESGYAASSYSATPGYSADGTAAASERSSSWGPSEHLWSAPSSEASSEPPVDSFAEFHSGLSYESRDTLTTTETRTRRHG